METWIRSKTIHQGPIFAVRTGEARLDDGTVVHREIVEHEGGVGVVPVVGDRVLLVRQYRIACGKAVLEIPAGRVEGGEDIGHRARCELEEEVGYRAGRLVHVARCHCSPGFTNELDHIFLAFDLEKTQQNLEFDERIEIVELPIADIEDKLEQLEFDDGKTIIGLRELLAYLAKHPEHGGGN